MSPSTLTMQCQRATVDRRSIVRRGLTAVMAITRKTHPEGPQTAGLPSPHPSDFVTTRLAPAAQNTRLIDRSRVIDALEAAAAARLILVEAPAGYGKTSLLAQWREKLLQRGAAVAWLTLDEDESAAELLAHIERAIIAAGVRSGAATQEPNPAAADSRQRLRCLLNTIGEASQHVVLVLDEFENASTDFCRDVLEPLLRRAPSNLQVLLASRVHADLQIAALRARGLVVGLGAEELRLRSEEIAQLFDCELSRRELAAVTHTTDGWPVAVQLLRADRASGASLHPFSVDGNAHVAAYVMEEILAKLSPAQRSLLQEVTVLEQLDANAVAAVTGRPEDWASILAAPQLQPFLRPIERGAQIRHLHPIIHGVLAAEFASAEATRRHPVLRAAARWYAHQNSLPRAVTYALACNDLNLAAELILEAGGVHIWIRRGKAVTKGVDVQLNEELLARFPRIRLLRALVQIKDGQLIAGRRSFDEVRGATAGFTQTAQGDAPLLRQDSLVVEATLLINECRPASDAYLESVERSICEVAGDDHLLQGLVRNLLCIACAQRGMFDRAIPAAHAAIEHYARAGAMHGQLFEHLHLGSIAFAQGMPATAKAEYARAREIARRHFSDDQAKSVLLNALGAELAYEQNLLGQALRLSRQAALYIGHIELWYDIYAAQFVTSTMIGLERGGLTDALAAVDAARQEVLERNATGVMRLLDALQVSCLALAGAVDAAHELMLERGLDLAAYLQNDEEILWREREAVLVAALRVAARKPVVAVPVAEVEEALGRLWAGKQIRAAFRVGAALAVFYWSLDRPAQALAHLDNVLRASQRSGYVRGIAEDRDRMRPVIERWRDDMQDASNPELSRHVDGLLQTLASGGAAPPTPPGLTDRENEILQEISRGRSDKEIARSLRLSENTVKFHLKNLYTKLQVARRIDAVQQARRRGMVQ